MFTIPYSMQNNIKAFIISKWCFAFVMLIDLLTSFHGHKDIELEDDPEQKIVEDAQEKDYLDPGFQMDEELADGEDIEHDILLEGEDEADNDANDEGDDDEVEDEDVEEEEEKNDDGEVKELEEGVEIMKLEEDIEGDSVQAEAIGSNDKEDEV